MITTTELAATVSHANGNGTAANVALIRAAAATGIDNDRRWRLRQLTGERFAPIWPAVVSDDPDAEAWDNDDAEAISILCAR